MLDAHASLLCSKLCRHNVDNPSHMWVEFVVVGSHPCSEGFSPGTPVFLPPQKPTFLNSNSTWKQWSKSHSVDSTEIPIYFIFIMCGSKRRHCRHVQEIFNGQQEITVASKCVYSAHAKPSYTRCVFFSQ